MELFYSIMWAVITVLLIGIEFASVALVSIWFAVGAIGGFIASLVTDNLWLQLLVFVIVSVIMLLATRPFVNKIMRNRKVERTNVDQIIGKVCILTKAMTTENPQGMTEIDGVFWLTVAKDIGQTFSEHEKVKIDGISGSKLVVSKLTT